MDQWADIQLPRTLRNDGDVASELTNMMAVPSVPGSDKQYMLRSTPGIDFRVTAGAGAMRGAIAHGDYVWWVRGTNLYRWDGTTNTLVGTVAGTAFVQMVGCGPNQIAIVDGAGNEYVATTAAVAALTPPAGDFGDVTFMDGYIIAPRVGTDEWYVSALDGTTFAALDFSTADAISDKLVATYVHNREVHLLGEQHIEIWLNTGASPFPFQRAVPGVIDKGVRAAGSVAHYGSSLFFLGRDFRVYRLDGYIPVPISDDLVEENIRIFFTTANAVRASTYVDRGVPCYCISMSAGTAGFSFVYNMRDGVWHSQFHTDGGSAVIDYADIVEFKLSTFSLYVAGICSSSAANGFDPGLYSYSGEQYPQDQGNAVAFVSRPCTVSIGPLQLAGGLRVFIHELELTTDYVADATQAVALYLDGDEGAVLRSASTISGHGGVLQWHRNGMARRPTIRFEMSSDKGMRLHRLRARVSVGN